jgi:hypothetical protein
VIAAVISSRIHCFSDVGIAFINDITISSKQHHHAIESCASQGRERKKNLFCCANAAQQCHNIGFVPFDGNIER